MCDVIVVKESEGLFVGNEVYIEFRVMCIAMGVCGYRYGIEVSFWVYEECRLRAR